ncbi:helicase-associated domain-containing protein [Cryobacterium sp. 1639]|uniref:helicase-associated domain-containing protein n=1 Tax=Cryobacterium inferilacus TaxID=2866629 RepID=UPI001C73B53D|nr:helicase-associated domain-containing protein [Cryobacterium sp. 1639]MBX0300295.1 helicase-associated domain-containing protein [Cryobacterium sp. 1639]
MLTLSSRLRALDDDALRRTIDLRGISPHGITDFFDLAEALLDPDAIEAALSHLDRSTLAVLAVAGDLGAPTVADVVEGLAELGHDTRDAADIAARVERLDELMLVRAVDGIVRPYPEVITQLRGWPQRGLPSTADLAGVPAPTPLAPLSATDGRFTERLAAERAFSAVSAIAELITELSREPARELSRGGLGLPDTKRLATVMGIDVDEVAALVSVAGRAGLVVQNGGYWLETAGGEEWLLGDAAARWSELARSWLNALPPDVREILAQRPGVAWGDALHRFVAWLYPAGGGWMDERIAVFARDAELIGITARQTTSAAGASVLVGDIDAAMATIAASLPAEVGTVYLQHDLSIVAPGPLAPWIDARVRTFADVESRELASTFRLSGASVNRALALGDDADSLLAFLASISVTGVPQPVDYLVRDAAARYGRVRVGSIDSGDPAGASYIASDDSALLDAIAVDQTVSALDLTRISADRLTSLLPAATVFWALTDARYPVAAEDAAGTIVHPRRHPLSVPARADRPDPLITLVQTLRATDGGEAKAAHAWLARQLDSAIKHRQTVQVSVRMPDGDIVEYLLEPASVNGGRFRARDRHADIERTLPLSSVVSITPAP